MSEAGGHAHGASHARKRRVRGCSCRTLGVKGGGIGGSLRDVCGMQGKTRDASLAPSGSPPSCWRPPARAQAEDRRCTSAALLTNPQAGAVPAHRHGVLPLRPASTGPASSIVALRSGAPRHRQSSRDTGCPRNARASIDRLACARNGRTPSALGSATPARRSRRRKRARAERRRERPLLVRRESLRGVARGARMRPIALASSYG